MNRRALRVMLHALGLVLALTSATVAAEGATREDALKSLSGADPVARRDAAARLGEVGTMGDVPALVKALRDPDEDTRDEAQQAIWRIWARSGDREVDRLYQTGIDQMSAGEFREGIATFTHIIELKPEFAEGWNKRATLYFLTGDLRKSLADCDEVMKRNPYHFGALAGYAQIYIRLELYERALDYARRALAINPNLDGMRQIVQQLEHVIEERRKLTI